jgi:hypothetical protein
MKPVQSACPLPNPVGILSFRLPSRLILAWLLPVTLSFGGLAWAADLPEMDYGQMLKPLVDTTGKSPSAGGYSKVSEDSLYGHANQQSETQSPSPQKPLVLSGKIETLQQAIESERNTVDWYAWYLAARDYLSRTGGLQCALGTPIKFYRNGEMEALTDELRCRASMLNRNFPLPPRTRLDAVILPVRRGTAPPASPDELYSRIREY